MNGWVYNGLMVLRPSARAPLSAMPDGRHVDGESASATNMSDKQLRAAHALFADTLL